MSDITDLLNPKNNTFKVGDVVQIEKLMGRFPQVVKGEIKKIDDNGLVTIEDRFGREHTEMFAFMTIVRRKK